MNTYDTDLEAIIGKTDVATLLSKILRELIEIKHESRIQTELLKNPIAVSKRKSSK